MNNNLKTPVFIAAMFVLTVVFTVVGNDLGSKWRMSGIQAAATDYSADKTGCIFAAWDKQQGAVERVTGCEQYDEFRGSESGAAVLADTGHYGIDW